MPKSRGKTLIYVYDTWLTIRPPEKNMAKQMQSDTRSPEVLGERGYDKYVIEDYSACDGPYWRSQ